MNKNNLNQIYAEIISDDKLFLGNDKIALIEYQEHNELPIGIDLMLSILNTKNRIRLSIILKVIKVLDLSPPDGIYLRDEVVNEFLQKMNVGEVVFDKIVRDSIQQTQ